MEWLLGVLTSAGVVRASMPAPMARAIAEAFEPSPPWPKGTELVRAHGDLRTVYVVAEGEVAIDHLANEPYADDSPLRAAVVRRGGLVNDAALLLQLPPIQQANAPFTATANASRTRTYSLARDVYATILRNGATSPL